MSNQTILEFFSTSQFYDTIATTITTITVDNNDSKYLMTTKFMHGRTVSTSVEIAWNNLL